MPIVCMALLWECLNHLAPVINTFNYLIKWKVINFSTDNFDNQLSMDFSFFYIQFILFYFFPFIFISWRLITLQYCSGICHTLTWISHGFTCVPHPDSPLTSLSIPSLWVFPMHQPWALVSCIQPGLVICFTLDSILLSKLFSQNILPLPSPTESQSLFCTSVSLFLFCL